MFNKLFIGIFLMSLCFSSAFSQRFDQVKLDSLFDVLAINNKSMGSVAVSKAGELVYAKSIGYRTMNDKEKFLSNVHTQYRVGSISKTFTAVLVVQLIEEKKLSLTTTLDKYFPKVPNAKKITVSNLLNHRSGLHNFTDEEDYYTWMTSSKTKLEMLDIISKYKVDFEPNAKYSYSNSNYVLLGYIIESVCKKTYAEVLKEKITDKLGLKYTAVGGKINVDRNECNSYRYLDQWLIETESDMSIPGGAGFIISTPSDLNTFMTALFAGELVHPNSLIQMKTMIDGYGMGLIAIPFYNKQGFGHTGGIDGFRSVCVYFPDDSVAVSYCSNGEVVTRNDVLLGVLNIYYGKPYVIPSFKTVVLSEEELQGYVGIYASSQMPLKITISKQKNTLTAQATGQSAFPLTAKDKNVFSFEQAGIVMEFNSTDNTLTLKQGGQTFLFTKEK